MTARVRLIVLLALAFTAGLPCPAGETIDFEGSFVWERNEKTEQGTLAVTLTPIAKNRWDVEFRFDWEGEPRLFTGTAWGSLSGTLTGKVDSDDPGHPLKFRFEGDFTEGAFVGTHGYYNGLGKLVESGTLKLTSPGKS